MLEVKALTKKFGPIMAVDKLSFTVNKGEVCGFLGPNGAGKTTTMRMITNFISSSSGSVIIDGLDTKTHDIASRKKIGYLPETTPLYGDMFVDEYLNYVATLRGLSGAYKKTQIEKILTLCGLKPVQKRTVAHLSKGYRQRIGLAQALIHEPDLLILDEPMSGLDPNQIIEIRSLIKEIGKTKTVLYCSHILSEVSATCDRVLIINNGKIAIQGTPDEISRQSKKHYLYNVACASKFADNLKKHVTQIPSVSAIILQEELGDQRHFTIESDSNNLGEMLFACAVDHQIVLSEITPHSVSLEDVFTKLTGNRAS